MSMETTAREIEVTELTQLQDELAELRRDHEQLRRRYRRLENELATARGWRCQLGLMLESLPVGIIGIDGRGQVALCTGQAAKLLGLDGRSMLHQPLADALRHHPLTRPLQQLLARDAGDRETLLSWKTGDSRHDLRVWAEQIRNSSGVLIGATLVLADASGERGLQQKRSTALLSISHELRNPLTSIIGFTELMLDSTRISPEQRQQFLHYILQKGKLLQRIIEDLQTMARLEEGQGFQLQREDADLRPLLQKVCDQFRWEHPDYNFELELASERLPTHYDRQRVEQVLHNLLSNAVKYAPSGTSVRLQAGIWQEMVQVSVCDQGHGMNSDDELRAFDRHFRSAGIAGDVEGLGLGLTICRAIVQAHGGTINLQSRPGEGTEVRFSLPAARDEMLSYRAPELSSRHQQPLHATTH